MPTYSAYEFVAIVRAPMMFPDRGDLVLRGLAVTRIIAHVLLTVPRGAVSRQQQGSRWCV
jgi:hypothetical protein